MNLQKCPNNHFYDAEKYDECPHCKKAGMSAESIPAVKRPMEPRSVKKEEHKEKRSILDFMKKEPADNVTRSMNDPIQPQPQSISQPVSQSIPAPQPMPQSVSIPTSQPHPQTVAPVMQEAPSYAAQSVMPQQSLAAQVQAAQNVSEPKTIGIWGSGVSHEPVVGWLVCISGPNQGEAFELRAGKNFIGRSAIMDVVIEKDNKISRDKHSAIMYEPMGRQFILLANEGSGMTYLNDKIALNTQELKDRDILMMGDSKLMLVSFCGENFTWDDWITN